MQSAVVFCCVASPHGNKSADLVTLVIFHMTNYARLCCLEWRRERRRERGRAVRERVDRQRQSQCAVCGAAERKSERASGLQKVASCDKATANGPSVMQASSTLVPHPSPMHPATLCECSQLADGQFESSEWVKQSAGVDGDAAVAAFAIEWALKVEQGWREEGAYKNRVGVIVQL